MKKLLYGTTALATMGFVAGLSTSAMAASDRLQIEVHGYHQQWLVLNDIGLTELKDGNGDHPFDLNVVDQKHNSEICFTGEYTLDVGITYGVNVQLEANSTGDQIDESYLYLSTPEAGKLIVGDENNAAYLLQVTAPNGGIAHNQANLTAAPNGQGFVPLPGDFDSSDTTVDGTLLRFDDNDSGKFTYISPRLAGFQMGLSYIPNFEPGGDNNNSISRVNGGPGPGNTPSGIKDGVAAGLGFKEKFGSVGVAASLGYLFGDVPSSEGSSNLNAASGGLELSMAGFSVGGSYTWANGDKASGGGGQSYDGYSFDAGITYSIGAYKVGLVYMKGESEGLRANGSKQYADYLVLSGTYQLGPGVRLIGGLYAWDLDGEDGANGANELADSRALGGAVGVTLSF